MADFVFLSVCTHCHHSYEFSVEAKDETAAEIKAQVKAEQDHASLVKGGLACDGEQSVIFKRLGKLAHAMDRRVSR